MHERVLNDARKKPGRIAFAVLLATALASSAGAQK